MNEPETIFRGFPNASDFIAGRKLERIRPDDAYG